MLGLTFLPDLQAILEDMVLLEAMALEASLEDLKVQGLLPDNCQLAIVEDLATVLLLGPASTGLLSNRGQATVALVLN